MGWAGQGPPERGCRPGQAEPRPLLGLQPDAPPTCVSAFPRLQHRRRHLLAPDPRAQGRGRPDERPPAPHWPRRRSCFSWSAWPASTPDIRHLLLLDPPTFPSDPQLCPSQFREERNSGCWLAKGPPPEKLRAPREGAAGAERGHVLGPPCPKPPTPTTALGPPAPPRLQPSTLCSKLPLVSPRAGSLGLTDGGGAGSRAHWKGHPPCTVVGPRPLAFRFGHCPVQWPSVC